MIHVIAMITAKPGQRDAVLAAFRANMPAVLAEDGCIEYVPVIDLPDAGRMQSKLGADSFAVIEKWCDAAALRAHALSPHMASYAEATKEMVADRAVHVLTEA